MVDRDANARFVTVRIDEIAILPTVEEIESLVARQLGVTIDDVWAIAGLSEAASDASRDLGLDNNVAALLAATKASDPGGQVRVLEEAAAILRDEL